MYDSSDQEDVDVQTSSGDGGGGDFSLLSMGYVKLIFLMFLLFLFINSDIFTDKILSNISGTIDHAAPTSKGIFIQAMIYITGFIAIDSFIRA